MAKKNNNGARRSGAMIVNPAKGKPPGMQLAGKDLPVKVRKGKGFNG